MPAHLRIVAFNDVYALDNLPRLATLVDAARAGCDRLLVTVAGDFLAPSVLSSLDDGRGMVAVLTAIGVTHVTFGNHEDDVPSAALIARVAELPVKWLASNVHGLGLPARDVVEVGAVRVGLLGVVLVDPLVYRHPPFGATLEDPEVAAVREAKRLVADGCAWVVALTHQTVPADRALAGALAGVPAIVLGGHEHTSFDETVAGTRILKAGAEATHAWIVDAIWRDGGAPEVTARLEPVAGYAEHAGVRALVEGRLAPVRALATATLLELEPGQVLSSDGSRVRQTSIGELVCSRLRDTLHADACVFNGGGIRAARVYTERFTYGDLEAEMPFDNALVVVAMPGAVLEHAIVASRAAAPVESGAFLQVDDRIAIDAAGSLTQVAGAPFDPRRTYRVALVRDLCFGLDRIEPLIAFARDRPDVIPPAHDFRTPRELLVRSFAGSLLQQLGGFAAVDTNHDGRISPDEIAAALARRDGGAPSPVIGEIIVRALDRDGDGVVSPGESDDLS